MRATAFLSATLVLAVSACGQGTFQNLDFEAARIVFNPNLGTTNALPGWSAFSGTNELANVFYNQFTFFPEVGLYGSNSFAISGYFGVLLRVDGAISQTGMVPADAESLLFKGSWSSLTRLSVSLGGQNLSYTAISNAPNYTLYGADVSMFAGQTTPLTFRAPSSSLYFLDDIQFSAEAIPEPSSLALLGCGGVLLTGHWVRRFRKRK
jgi:hypothetical protein